VKSWLKIGLVTIRAGIRVSQVFTSEMLTCSLAEAY
jgi:hypothetical protein